MIAAMFAFHGGLATRRGNEMSRPQALFTAVNAGTLTGFQQARGTNEYSDAGQLIVAALTVAGIVFALLAAGTAVTRVAGIACSDRKLFLATVIGIAVAAAVGVLALRGPDRSAADAAFDGVSALGGVGLFLGRMPAGNSPVVLVVMVPLVVLGSFGSCAWVDLWESVRRRKACSAHTRTTLSATAIVFLILTVLLVASSSLAWSGRFPSFAEARDTSLNAVRTAAMSRTAAFPFQSLGDLSRPDQWLILLGMLIGGAPGGAGGGLKVTTLAVIVTAAASSLRGSGVRRVLGQALVWVGVYLALVFGTLLILLGTEPQMPGDRLLFLAVGSVGNVGLSHDPVTISDAGLYTLSVVMILGRVAPVLALWWAADLAAVPEVAVD